MGVFGLDLLLAFDRIQINYKNNYLMKNDLQIEMYGSSFGPV